MRHRGSLPTTSALIIFAFYLHTSANTHHRLKRQTLPSDHIQVHSFNSNVSIKSSTVSVVSDESRIDLTERFLSGQIWSQSSLLEFEPRGHSENIYATDMVRTLFSVLGANLSTKADRLEVLLSSNRSEDGHSHLEMVAESDIDLVLLVSEAHVEAANAGLAHISMHTWQLSLEPRLTLTSNVSTAMNRQLFITSTTNNYNLIITLDGAKVSFLESTRCCLSL
uniref:Uncharacterized protein n=1 Tax=Parascaris univalens TaxID=6257 RepID=A0A915BAE3_PARUN